MLSEVEVEVEIEEIELRWKCVEQTPMGVMMMMNVMTINKTFLRMITRVS